MGFAPSALNWSFGSRPVIAIGFFIHHHDVLHVLETGLFLLRGGTQGPEI